jgi:hypothetical protein
MAQSPHNLPTPRPISGKQPQVTEIPGGIVWGSNNVNNIAVEAMYDGLKNIFGFVGEIPEWNRKAELAAKEITMEQAKWVYSSWKQQLENDVLLREAGAGRLSIQNLTDNFRRSMGEDTTKWLKLILGDMP